VWAPKYQKAVLRGEVAICLRDVVRQIAAEHELEIVPGRSPVNRYTRSSRIDRISP
jgi:REP element-mobilizing transposase RayT